MGLRCARCGLSYYKPILKDISIISNKKYSQSTVNALVDYEESLLFGEVCRVSEKQKK